ncbi:MAG: CPBP family intramembrane glutamic endopeptidase [Planctomycetota bacterium]|jgi:membrane protease YdiL (CAAX protease family)
MTPQLIDHIAFVFLAVAFPIWDFFAIRRRAALIRAGRTELRMGLYRRIIGEEWLMAIVLLTGWFALGRGGAALGLVPRGGALAWTGYSLSVLVIATLLIQVRSLLRNPESLPSIRDKLGKVVFLLPHTQSERRAFNAVSVTAGVCEEVFFRGYLIAYLMAVFATPFWVAALLSSVVFGFAHAYQGPLGIPRTAAAGGLLALLYGLTGSLWAPMVVHAVIDITSGRIAYAAINQEAPGSSSPELAVTCPH